MLNLLQELKSEVKILGALGDAEARTLVSVARYTPQTPQRGNFIQKQRHPGKSEWTEDVLEQLCLLGRLRAWFRWGS